MYREMLCIGILHIHHLSGPLLPLYTNVIDALATYEPKCLKSSLRETWVCQFALTRLDFDECNWFELKRRKVMHHNCVYSRKDIIILEIKKSMRFIMVYVLACYLLIHISFSLLFNCEKYFASFFKYYQRVFFYRSLRYYTKSCNGGPLLTLYLVSLI